MIPVFPLSGALLLPRGQMPLNIFEPRYLAMVDDALRMTASSAWSNRTPRKAAAPLVPRLYQVGCAGRVTQFAETGDGRYLITLTGVARFRVEDELATTTPYRLCRVVFEPYAADFQARSGEDEVDRPGVSEGACATSSRRTTSRSTGAGSSERPTRRWSTRCA